MLMPMMDVWKVPMVVRDGFMHMFMGMRFFAIPRESMRMLMVGVVPVRMTVGAGIVSMRVRMTLDQMQPQASGHGHKAEPEQ